MMVTNITCAQYKTAGSIVEKALRALVPQCKEGASILELCKAGDKAIEDEADKVYNKKGAEKVGKGLAYPTCLSVNGVLGNFSPLPTDTVHGAAKLKNGDLVSIQLGAHIDGYAVIGGESLVVAGESSSAVEGVQADLLQAAYQAAEISLRAAKPGLKNWEIAAGISKIIEEYKEKSPKLKGVESASTNAQAFGWRMSKDDIQNKKTIIPFPTSEQRRDSDNTHTLEEGEVYSLTVAVTNAEDGKVRSRVGSDAR